MTTKKHIIFGSLLLSTLNPQLSSSDAAVRTWTGDGPNNRWTVPANWFANALPDTGDDLLFQSGAAHPNCNNDFASGTTFNSIELRGGGGPGYDMGGNAIALNAGLRVENNSGSPISHTVNNSLLLNSNQTFTVINDVGVLNLVGSIDLNGKEFLLDVAASSEARVHGAIIGTGSLVKSNAGTLLLAANNSYGGPTTLLGGTLLINGTQPASPLVLIAGTLKGGGTIGTVNSVGAGDPGSILLSPGGSPGILTCSNVTLNPSTTVALELNGTTPGAGHAQLSVRGSVFLDNAALTLSFGFSTAVGNSFVIISNDGADPVLGSFSGFPEGAVFTNSGAVYRLTYAGGDGNDVVLTRINPPARLTGITALSGSVSQVKGLGLPNLAYTIHAATNLGPPILWSNLGPASADGAGVFTFTDTNAPLFPTRYYRAVSP